MTYFVRIKMMAPPDVYESLKKQLNDQAGEGDSIVILQPYMELLNAEESIQDTEGDQ